MKEVIHCVSQEEWNTVCDFYNSIWKSRTEYASWNSYRDQSCINILNGCYSSRSHNRNNKIYSFKNWLRDYNLDKKEDLSYLTEFLIKNEIT